MSAMNAEFFDAIEQIEKEKGIPRGYMQEKIQQERWLVRAPAAADVATA